MNSSTGMPFSTWMFLKTSSDICGTAPAWTTFAAGWPTGWRCGRRRRPGAARGRRYAPGKRHRRAGRSAGHRDRGADGCDSSWRKRHRSATRPSATVKLSRWTKTSWSSWNFDSRKYTSRSQVRSISGLHGKGAACSSALRTASVAPADARRRRESVRRTLPGRTAAARGRQLRRDEERDDGRAGSRTASSTRRSRPGWATARRSACRRVRAARPSRSPRQPARRRRGRRTPPTRRDREEPVALSRWLNSNSSNGSAEMTVMSRSAMPAARSASTARCAASGLGIQPVDRRSRLRPPERRRFVGVPRGRRP